MLSETPARGSHFDQAADRYSAPPKRAWRLALAAWRRHHDLLTNAASLLATTGVTAALGFVYWALAARLFSTTAVGYASAAVSAMSLLGTFGMLGLGTLLIGELPRRSNRGGLVSAALLTCGVGSLILGVGFAVIAPQVNGRFKSMIGTPPHAALFAVGVGLTGVTLVFDQATIGLMRGGLQFWRNIVFSIAKLLALPATALVLHDELGAGITMSWVIGMLVSLVMTAVRLRIAGTSVFPKPDLGLLRGLSRAAIAHNWLNLAITLPSTLMPVLVTLIVSPSANAAFYVASMLTEILFIIPTHLATVLFAVVAADPQVIARKMRFALRLTYGIGLPGMAVLILGSHLALGLFGPEYTAIATVPLWLMILGYPPAVPKALYLAVCRAEGKMSKAAAVLTSCSAVEMVAAAAGGIAHGLIGLSLALLVVRYLEAVVTTPPVIRAAFGQGRHRRTGQKASAASQAPARTPPRRTKAVLASTGNHSPLVTRYRPASAEQPSVTHGAPVPPGRHTGQRADAAATAGPTDAKQQQAGIAALLSLARSAAHTGPIPAIRLDFFDPEATLPHDGAAPVARQTGDRVRADTAISKPGR